MGFLLETHMHTKEASACATLDAASQVRQYKAAGYDGIIVTDHFVNGNSRVDRSLAWEEQMREQFKGYRKACEEGERLGLKVFCGSEYAYYGTEFIVIGLGEDWFCRHHEVMEMEPTEFLTYFREAGAAIIQAHPFRKASYIKEIRLYPELVDAVEVYNHSNWTEWNRKAREFAERTGRPFSSGSDCHHRATYGGGIILEKAPEDEADLISIIRGGSGWKIVEGELP